MFAESQQVILAFPFYTDAMPGIVKQFTEQFDPLCVRNNQPKVDHCSHQTTGTLPPHFPKGSSQGQNRFQMIIYGIFFVYYKLL
jgi:hypothetical protein